MKYLSRLILLISIFILSGCGGGESKDPIIGSWQCTSRDYGSIGYVYFLESGGYSEKDLYMVAGYPESWERVDESHIVIRGQYTSSRAREAIVTGDTLVINNFPGYFDCTRQ